MTQHDIPVQPRETAVTASLRRFGDSIGAASLYTTNGSHSTTSLHYVGRADDLASVQGPGVDSAELLRINKACAALIPPRYISELIYAGPGGVCMKNGRVVNGLAVYGAATMAEHHNHVHLAVTPDFVFTAPPAAVAKEASVSDAPPDYEVAAAPVSITVTASGNGYIILCADGGVFCFGDAKYLGRVHVKR